VVFAVKDTGIGMSQSEVSRIFDPFTQADNSIQREYGGTGLGMTITKNLCELMGGQIRVKAMRGQGSTFAIVLPLLEKGADISPSIPAPQPPKETPVQPALRKISTRKRNLLKVSMCSVSKIIKSIKKSSIV